MKLDDVRNTDKYELLYQTVGSICVIIPIVVAILITRLIIKL